MTRKRMINDQLAHSESAICHRLLSPGILFSQLRSVVSENSGRIVVERVSAAGAADIVGLALVRHFDRACSAGDDTFRSGASG